MVLNFACLSYSVVVFVLVVVFILLPFSRSYVLGGSITPTVNLPLRRRNVIATSSRRRRDVVATSSRRRRDIVATSSRRRRDVIATSSRRCRNVFATTSRRRRDDVANKSFINFYVVPGVTKNFLTAWRGSESPESTPVFGLSL